jgi:IclR family transcriptional regulator, pca regulon regulatory protein
MIAVNSPVTGEHMTQASKLPVADDFEHSPDYVQSLQRGLAVIRAFGAHAPAMTLSEVAAAAGLSRAVARRQLLTLGHLGYVQQDGRSFALTPRVLELGFSYLGALSYPELARPAMERLTRIVNESCSMGVLEGSDVVYVQRVPVRRIMTIALGLGAHLPAFCTSMGRVLLSGLEDAALRNRLESAPRLPRSEHTQTEMDALLRIIGEVRESGFAYVEQELERGLCSIAVPLRTADGRINAAINVSMAYGENARERALGEILPALRETARTVELQAAPKQEHGRTPGTALRSRG